MAIRVVDILVLYTRQAENDCTIRFYTHSARELYGNVVLYESVPLLALFTMSLCGGPIQTSSFTIQYVISYFFLPPISKNAYLLSDTLLFVPKLT